MNNIPTAKQLLADYSDNYKKALSVGREDRADVPGFMAEKVAIELAKLHCKAQLEAILEAAKIKMGDDNYYNYVITPAMKFNSAVSITVSGDSIKNAYLETNIK